MRILILSDVHGDVRALGAALGAGLPADKVLLAGDLLDPWARPETATVLAELLHSLGDRLVAVRGNNDTAATERKLGLPLPPYATVEADGKCIFLTHGHLYRAGSLPPLARAPDVIVTGHTHIARLAERDGVLLLNPGSIAFPRVGGPTYAVLENGKASLCNLTP